MRKKLLLLSFLAAVFALPARAQVTTLTAHVVSATVDGQQDGATGISTDAAVDVSFTFDQALPSVEEADFSLVEFIGDVTAVDTITLSTDKKTLTYSVEHMADTDYYWIISGSVFTDTTLTTLIQTVPYVLAYTTSDGSGRVSVSGTVDVSSAAAKTAADVKPMMLHGLHRASSLLRSASPSRRSAVAKPATSTAAPARASMAAVDAEGSVVLLIKQENPNPDFSSGQVVGAAAANAGGSYTVDFAPPGTYYAVAENIAGLGAGDFTGIFSAFFDFYIGSYDTNSDGAPDNVTAGASDVSGIDITIYPASHFAVTSVDADADARAFLEAQTDATDESILSVYAIGDQTDGSATFWGFEYLYTDPGTSSDMVLSVTREAFLIFSENDPDEAAGDEVPLPSDYPTTAELMTTLAANTDVGAFLDTHGDAPKLVWLSAGASLLAADPVGITNSDKMLWRASILSASETTDIFSEDAVVAYLDMSTNGIVQIEKFPALESDYVELATTAAPLAFEGLGDANLYNVSATGVDPLTGKAFGWIYAFSGGNIGGVDLGSSVSINALIPFVFPSFGADFPDNLPLVPEEHAAAEDVLTASEANGGRNFRNGHTDDAYVDIEGGYASGLLLDRPDLLTDHPEIATTPVWAVTYTEFKDEGETEVDSLVYVYDMASGDLITRVGVATGNEQEGELPSVASLQGSYPNPFRAQAHIPFALPTAQHVTLKVYNVLGQEVATLVDAVVPAGNQSVTWNATAVPSGVYFVRMKSEGATQSQKLVVQH
ncbi:MAG TPA: T9SS type A sorting domain-containing protein [Rhodothermales bacterium]|nr:T9SS type A sorting domain-containing protein [Rhodothermales bacterium]